MSREGFQLTIRHILERAKAYFGRKEVVSRTAEGFHRYTYETLYERVCRLAEALGKLGIRAGDRVASIAWNTHRHLELHFAVPMSGSVLHTVNLRYAEEEMVHVINKMGDRALFIEPDLLPILPRILPKLETVKKIVVLGEEVGERPALEGGLEVFTYEELLDKASGDHAFTDLSENTPAIMCSTSGTTGFPKTAVYTHRGIFLRSLATCLTDTYSISERDVVLHVVPMFHISSWFMPYAATLVGSKQVFPGPRPRPDIIHQLIREEGVTVTDGVPTVWIDFLNYLESKGSTREISSLKRIIVGGSPPPRALIKAYEDLGVEVIHAWGMTETYDSAIAFVRPKSYLDGLPLERKRDLKAKQGLPFPGIEVRILGEDGNPLPWDGKSVGELLVRGAWVISEYYGDPEATRTSFRDGWLRTGDMATIDQEGYVEIVDRTKDMIRSGGEWISSVKIEDEAMQHPAVMEAAAIAVPHPRWGERPLLIIKLKDEFRGRVSKEEILGFLAGRMPKWWVPDDLLFVDEIPKTGTGKLDKKRLRELHRNHYQATL